MKMFFLFFLAFISCVEQYQVADALKQSSYDTWRAAELRRDMGKPICQDIYSTISSHKKDRRLFQNAENMMLGTLPEINDDDKDLTAEIIAINGNSELNSLFYYSRDNVEDISPSDVLLIMRHGETAKTKNINPSQSGNPITADAQKKCKLIGGILQKEACDTFLYHSTTLRNEQTAIAISGVKTENVFTVPAIKELDLGSLQQNDKRAVLKNEKFKNAVCSLNKFPDAANTVANEILKFSAGIVKIFQHKERKIGIAVANSAMMGVVIYNILSNIISNYDFFENINSCIPANLDFFCLSYEPDNNGAVRFRIYDTRQVRQIFDGTNLGKYLSPSDKAKASIDGTEEGAFLQAITI